MAKDDPDAAYDLLAPQVQATLSREEFKHRWQQNAAERKAMLAEAKAMPDAETVALREGTTVHDGGRVLRWTLVGKRYVVIDGLPGRPRTATPAEAIRALIDAAHATDLSRIQAVLGDELSASLAEDWRARVDAIARALDDPGAIEISADLMRAELRYEPDRAIRLQQTADGWRIIALE